jgi:hypothetical protein
MQHSVAMIAALMILLQRPCLSGLNTAPFAKRKNRNLVSQPVPSSSIVEKKSNAVKDLPISNLMGVSLVGCFNDESDLALLENVHEDPIHVFTLSQSVYILVNAALVLFFLFSVLRTLCITVVSRTKNRENIAVLDKYALMYVPSDQVSVCLEGSEPHEEKKFKQQGSKEAKIVPNRSNMKTTPSKSAGNNVKKRDNDTEKHERGNEKSKEKQRPGEKNCERGSLSSKKAAASGKLQR